MLNAYTANAIGKKVCRGPSEQQPSEIFSCRLSCRLVNNKQEMRNMVARFFRFENLSAEDIQNWDSHYAEYLQATHNF
jgi:hypothetical protein